MRFTKRFMKVLKVPIEGLSAGARAVASAPRDLLVGRQARKDARLAAHFGAATLILLAVEAAIQGIGAWVIARDRRELEAFKLQSQAQAEAGTPRG